MPRNMPVLIFLASAMIAPAEEAGKSGQSPALVAEGKKVYEANCLVCHGASGRGDGQAAASLNPKPRNLSDASYMSKRPVETLRKVIIEGGQSEGLSPIMISWKMLLKPEQIDAALAYVLSLSRNLVYAENEGKQGSDPKKIVK